MVSLWVLMACVWGTVALNFPAPLKALLRYVHMLKIKMMTKLRLVEGEKNIVGSKLFPLVCVSRTRGKGAEQNWSKAIQENAFVHSVEFAGSIS